MPKWTDHYAVTSENLLSIFSADDFARLISGDLQLVVYNKGEGRNNHFYACDVKSNASPRYWALGAGFYFYALDSVYANCSLSRLTISSNQVLQLMDQASGLFKAYSVFSKLFEMRHYYNSDQKKHYDNVKTEMIDKMVREPKHLIEMIKFVLAQQPKGISGILSLLNHFKFYATSHRQFGQLLNAQYDGQSVLDVILAHPSLVANISQSSYFELVNLCHQYAVKPVTPALVACGVKWYGTEYNQFNNMLIWAADCADNAMVSSLLSDTAITRAVNADYIYPDSQEMAIHCALRSSASDDVLRQLIAQTKHLNHQDKWGKTPLMLAASTGREAVVDMLLRYQSVAQSMPLQDTEGNTALHHAARRESDASMQLLLNHPNMNAALVNRLNHNHDTALAKASGSHHNDQVRALLRCGANIYTSNKQRQSPVKLAGRHDDTVLLLHAGEDDYMTEAKAVPVVGVVEGRAVIVPPPVQPRVLEHQQRVIALLQRQMQNDTRFTADVPLVRKHIDRAVEAIKTTRDLPAIHRVLQSLYQKQVAWPESKGRTTMRSYLRSTTVVHLKHMGYLGESKITGKAKLTGMRYAMFSTAAPQIGRVSVAQPEAASVPPKPNDVRVAV